MEEAVCVRWRVGVVEFESSNPSLVVRVRLESGQDTYGRFGRRLQEELLAPHRLETQVHRCVSKNERVSVESRQNPAFSWVDAKRGLWSDWVVGRR